jgi:HAMP domain-containing protein
MSNGEKPRRWQLQIRLLVKILIAILISGLVPLILIVYSALTVEQAAAEQATQAASDSLDAKALRALQLGAASSAQQITALLNQAVQDTLALEMLPRNDDYLTFNEIHQGVIHYPVGTITNTREVAQKIPFYREITYIDASGQEQLRILDGKVVPAAQLRNVSDPANTTYHTETYFNETRALADGQIYVSHLTAWHMSVPAQPASVDDPNSPLPGTAFSKYEAVIRFATPTFDGNGKFAGIVMLSLDARHLIELVIHQMPLAPDTWTTWPDENSGNYAYVFDDQGFVIAHPTLDGIRGLDTQGQLISPLLPGTPASQQDLHPYNVQDGDAAGIYTATLQSEAGYEIATTPTGAHIAQASMPVFFNYGTYKAKGLFGGVVMAADVSQFHTAAATVESSLAAARQQVRSGAILIGLLSLVILTLIATLLAQGITRPVRRLTHAAELMEKGELDSAMVASVMESRLPDEVTKLARVFKQMAEQVEMRERLLKDRIEQLHIQIDEQKRAREVAEITDTDYFRELQEKAARMRPRARQERVGPGT